MFNLYSDNLHFVVNDLQTYKLSFVMKKNMATFDRIIRLVVVIALVGLNLAGITSGVLMIVCWVAAAIFTFTIATGFCPLYTLFGISTCKIEE
jgi:hypothetical protein